MSILVVYHRIVVLFGGKEVKTMLSYQRILDDVKKSAEEAKVIAGEPISAESLYELVAKSIYRVLQSTDFIQHIDSELAKRIRF
jgi:hypothetical protein